MRSGVCYPTSLGKWLEFSFFCTLYGGDKKSRLPRIFLSLLCQTAIIKEQMLRFRKTPVIGVCICVFWGIVCIFVCGYF